MKFGGAQWSCSSFVSRSKYVFDSAFEPKFHRHSPNTLKDYWCHWVQGVDHVDHIELLGVINWIGDLLCWVNCYLRTNCMLRIVVSKGSTIRNEPKGWSPTYTKQTFTILTTQSFYDRFHVLLQNNKYQVPSALEPHFYVGGHGDATLANPCKEHSLGLFINNGWACTTCWFNVCIH